MDLGMTRFKLLKGCRYGLRDDQFDGLKGCHYGLRDDQVRLNLKVVIMDLGMTSFSRLIYVVIMDLKMTSFVGIKGCHYRLRDYQFIRLKGYCYGLSDDQLAKL